jgi:hypothetical protein
VSNRTYLTRLEKALKEEREKRNRLELEVLEVKKLNDDLAYRIGITLEQP